jgi:ribulose 1,5-bisphosphate synthetase/thiazole synthase
LFVGKLAAVRLNNSTQFQHIRFLDKPEERVKGILKNQLTLSAEQFHIHQSDPTTIQPRIVLASPLE